ncbi:MAG TPA: MBOAT family protein [Pirellulaceae bacterium]|nr:MBOAT family protein [Pirellulaceae bacterium]
MIWAWTCLLLFPSVTLMAAGNLPPWQAMCWLTVATLAGCKAATWTLVDPRLADASRRLGYWFAWPGMDPVAFLLAPKQPRLRPTYSEWIEAAFMSVLGAAMIWGAVRWMWWFPDLAAWIAMAGLIFLGHFGLLELLSCAWRYRGIHARPLMDHPWKSATLADFWGRRWNTAFRDLAYRLVLLPVTRRFGAAAGLAAVFLFSGIIHDFVISVSARGGYGLPTLYFLIQGAATLLQRSAVAKRLGLDAGWRGWGVAMFVVFAPAGLLFHGPWRQNVILPLMEAIGAL